MINCLMKNKKVILCFSNYCPLQIWTLRICNQDTSKIIISRRFKLSQLSRDMVNKKVILFFRVIALSIFGPYVQIIFSSV